MKLGFLRGVFLHESNKTKVKDGWEEKGRGPNFLGQGLMDTLFYCVEEGRGSTNCEREEQGSLRRPGVRTLCGT